MANAPCVSIYARIAPAAGARRIMAHVLDRAAARPADDHAIARRQLRGVELREPQRGDCPRRSLIKDSLEMPRSTLRRELTLAIIFKIVAIFLLYSIFFSPSHRMHVTPADMAAALSKRPTPR
jgi:hypothetical protein